MNLIHQFFVLVIAMSFTFPSRSTGQLGDRLIYEGDTLELFSNPLEMYKHIDSVRLKFFGKNSFLFQNTACWRGYIAEWRIIDSNLYLSNIFTCDLNNDSTRVDLSEYFLLTENGYVAADWFSGTLYIPQGNLIHYVHSGYESIYEYEKMIVFEQGKFLKSHLNDNSLSIASLYEYNFESLKEHIYSTIQWDNLPDPEKNPVKVWIKITSGESPEKFTIELAKGVENPVYNEEAMRVVRLIPQWSVYYQHGKCVRRIFHLPVVFSEKHKTNYPK